MQNQTFPLALSFGASDPVGACGIQADLAAFAAMGCRGLTVITAILTGDTAQIDALHPLDEELVTDQARTVLEDMPVAAFKVGAVGSVENVTTIAEIVADYPDAPLVLAPFHDEATQDEAEKDIQDEAVRELLVPQASILVLSSLALARLYEEAPAPADQAAAQSDILPVEIRGLLESGCEYVLLTNAPAAPGHTANTLYHADGVLRHDEWPRVAGVHAGAGHTLSAALTALLVNGLSIPEAVAEAQEYTQATIHHARRLGMGRLIPDHFFWARSEASSSCVSTTHSLTD